MSQKDLIPLDKRTPEEAHRIRSEGAKARNRKAAERKTMREWAKALGEIPVKIRTPDGRMQDVTTLGAIVAAQMAQATKGNVKSAKFIADLLGEMVQNVAVQGPLIVSQEEMQALGKWAKKAPGREEDE